MKAIKHLRAGRLYLKAGLALGVFFPGVFVYDKVGENLNAALLLFAAIFCWILVMWIFNAVFIDFSQLSDKKRRMRVISMVLVSLAISTPVFSLFGMVFHQQQVVFVSMIRHNFSIATSLYFILRISLFNAGLLVIKYVLDQNREKQRLALQYEQLRSEQLRATHAAFRQQVDPHFLFNALNTMQSLVKQEKKADTLQFIQELGSVYRYMLIRRDRNVVPVRDEIAFLRSYLYLLQIRFGNAFRTEIRVSDMVLDSPMPVHTLQLLAENAVKHNAVTAVEPLLLLIRSDVSYLYVTNNIVLKQINAPGAGIGLENIAQRYRLLFDKEIVITSDATSFTVSLPIITDHEYSNH